MRNLNKSILFAGIVSLFVVIFVFYKSTLGGVSFLKSIAEVFQTQPENSKTLTDGTGQGQNKNPQQNVGQFGSSDSTSGLSNTSQNQLSGQISNIENFKGFESIEKMQAWMAVEAPLLNEANVDTKQKDIELKKIVENLTSEQKKMVLSTALDSNQSANNRILSAYMLVLDQSQLSEDNLGQMAKKALPDFGPINPHSEAELRRGQELSVRYMAIDELAKRAASNTEALAELKKQAEQSESEEVRKYARRLLGQLK